MASLTVRQLDERLKKRLRLRAARNGRSVEDEVRNILRDAAEVGGVETPAPVAALPAGAGALHPDDGSAAFRYAAVGERARRRTRVYRSLRSGERVRRRSHPARARYRCD